MKKVDTLQPVRHFLAEVFGTMVLALVVGVVGVASSLAGYGTLFAPSLIGLTIALLVYIIGPISGAHLNPAVSIAQFIYKKITGTEVVLYVIGQVLGAILGMQLAHLITTGVPVPQVSTSGVTAFAELLGVFLIVFTIMRAVQGKIAPPMSGLVIGAAFAVAIAATAPADSGILNPAIALATKSYSYTYLLMPFIGGILGAAFALFLDPPATRS